MWRSGQLKQRPLDEFNRNSESPGACCDEWPDLVGVSVVKEKFGVDARNRKTSRILCSLL